MSIDLFSFIAGCVVSLFFCVIIVVIASEIRKKRALDFTRRFASISEGLSSLKALAFRISGQLKRVQHHYQGKEIGKKDMLKLRSYLDGLNHVFEVMSVGMMPPTEEIALEALEGKATSSEEKAYKDSLKFRDQIRELRKILESEGLEGLAKQASPNKGMTISSETQEDIFYKKE